MKYNSPEHQIARREIRDKSNWSYFWAATAGITTIATILIATGGLPLGFMSGTAHIAGLTITALGGLGAGIQSYSYDREAASLHDKLEIALAKGAEPDSKELGNAIKELKEEIHTIREQNPMGRKDGQSWVQFVEKRNAVRDLLAQSGATPSHPS